MNLLLRRVLGVTLTIALLAVLCSPCRGDAFDVYVAAGQSNMDGRALSNELIGDLAQWNAPQADVWLHYTRPADASDPNMPTVASGWTSLAPGYSLGPGSMNAVPSNSFGPEISFGRAMATSRPGWKTAIVKIARGGTSLADHWAPNDASGSPAGEPGDMYRSLTKIVPQAMQQLRDLGHEAQLRGMIWHQGEADAVPDASIYQERLGLFIESVRTDLNSPQLPFVIGELSGASRGFAPTRHAQLLVSQQLPHVGFASSAGLVTYDVVHFNGTSQFELGQRFADAMNALLTPEPHSISLMAIAGIDAIRCARRRIRRTS